MDLASHQRKMLGLIRSTYQVQADDPPYIHRVAESPDLMEARRNVFLWRVYVLERTCPLTFALLKQRNLLGKTLTTFIASHNISPFRETQAPAFLGGLTIHADDLVASVAQFELALMKVKQGDQGRHVVHWNVEPQPILRNLATGTPIEVNPLAGIYQIVVSASLPTNFQVYMVQAA